MIESITTQYWEWLRSLMARAEESSADKALVTEEWIEFVEFCEGLGFFFEPSEEEKGRLFRAYLDTKM